MRDSKKNAGMKKKKKKKEMLLINTGGVELSKFFCFE